MDESQEPNPFTDPAPGILLGDTVQMNKERLDDDDIEVALKGDIGTVTAKEFHADLGWCLPTVTFERTGAIYDVTPDEVDVVAPADFATREETTPKKPVRVYLKRGAQ